MDAVKTDAAVTQPREATAFMRRQLERLRQREIDETPEDDPILAGESALNILALTHAIRAVNSHQALVEALRALTEHMDRAGGDAHGMPECPWCHADSNDNEHRGECELVQARAALAQAEKEQ